MFDLGPYAYLIVLSYAITTVVFVLMIIWVFLEEHSQNKIIKKLEKQGVKRRSAGQ